MPNAIVEILEEIRGLSAKLDALDYPREALLSFPPESEASLAAVEQATGMPIPSALRTLLATHGGFFIRQDVDGLSLTFYNRPTSPQPFGGLAAALDGAWSWNEYRNPDEFTPQAIDTLNATFVCFGHAECDENSFDHFFYDAHGRFGVLRFDQEFMDDDALEHLHALGTGENPQPAMTLDEVLLPRLKAARSSVAGLLRQFAAYRAGD